MHPSNPVLLLRPKQTLAAPSVKTFTYRGGDKTAVGSVTWTQSTIDIGASTADRFVIIVLEDQNDLGFASATVNGVSLTQAVPSNAPGGGANCIWCGLIGTAGGAGVATIVATGNGGASGTSRGMHVYTGTGMSNTTGAATTATSNGTTTLNISVTAGDFLVMGTDNGPGRTFAGSTETPSASHSQTQAPIVSYATEWNTILATNASFAIVGSGTFWPVAATFR